MNGKGQRIPAQGVLWVVIACQIVAQPADAGNSIFIKASALASPSIFQQFQPTEDHVEIKRSSLADAQFMAAVFSIASHFLMKHGTREALLSRFRDLLQPHNGYEFDLNYISVEENGVVIPFRRYGARFEARVAAMDRAASLMGDGVGWSGEEAYRYRVDPLSDDQAADGSEEFAGSRTRVSFSLMGAADSGLIEEVRRAQKAGVGAVHIDHLDGVLTPGSLPFDCASQISRTADVNLPIDVHLMCVEPDASLIDRIKTAGLKEGQNSVSVHYESFADPGSLAALIGYIKKSGYEAGLVLNPDTPLSVLNGVFGMLGDQMNKIVLMAVTPGGSGRTFIPGTFERVAGLKKMFYENGIRNVAIEIDGGMNSGSLPMVLNAGVDSVVLRTWLLEPGRGIEAGLNEISGVSNRLADERRFLMEMLREDGIDMPAAVIDAVVDFCNGAEVYSEEDVQRYLAGLPGVIRLDITKDRIVDVYYSDSLLRFHKKEIVPIEHMGLMDRTYYKGVSIKLYHGDYISQPTAGYILGISGSWHDSTAVLVRDGRVVSILEEERISRTKHDTSRFPVNAIHRMLKDERITLDDISHIAIGWNYNIYVDTPHSTAPNDEFFAQMDQRYIGAQNAPAGNIVRRNVPEKNKARFSVSSLEDFLKGLREYYGTAYTPRVSFVRHHLAHAASAYYPSGFKDPTLVVSLDGYGDTETGSIWVGNDGDMEEVARYELPNSLGWVWAAMTEYLGFRPTFAEGEVMGFAPYGEPRDETERGRVRKLRALFNDYVRFDYATGQLSANPHYLYYGKMARGKVRVSQSFVDRVSALVLPSEKSSQDVDPIHVGDRPLANLAFVLQEATDRIVADIVRYYLQAHPRTRGLKKVTLGGGIALNILSNGKLISEGLVKGEDLFVQPLASDAGTALGAALTVAKQIYHHPVAFEMDHVSYGPGYTDRQIRDALSALGLVAGRDYARMDEERLVEEAAQCIARNEPIAWFQGRSEAGPRALGARSILLNLLDDTANNTANAIKGRQSWRPSALSIIEEAAEDYFVASAKAPFMIVAYDVRQDKKHLLASGVHQYGKRLARPQTVNRRTHPRYWKLLNRIGELTGVPAVVNTSFNKQEPLVENPEEAINTFRYMTGVNNLFIGNYIVRKRERWVPSILSLKNETSLEIPLQRAVASGDINDWSHVFEQAAKRFPQVHKLVATVEGGPYGAREINIPLSKDLFEGPLRSVLLRYAGSMIYNYAIEFGAKRIYIGSTSKKMSEVLYYQLSGYLRDHFKRIDYFSNLGAKIEILPLSVREEEEIFEVMPRTHLFRPPAWGEREGNYIGVDVGANKVKCVLVADGHMERILVRDTVTAGGAQLAELIKSMVRETAQDRTVSGIGIAFPGVVDVARKRVVWMVNYEFVWKESGKGDVAMDYAALNRLSDELSQEYGTNQAAFLNDGSAFGIATLAAEGEGNGVLLTLGTGVGSARLENGAVDMGRIEQGGAFVINIREDAPFDEGCGVKGGIASYVGVEGMMELARIFGLPTIVRKEIFTAYDLGQLLDRAEGVGYAEAKRLYREVAEKIAVWVRYIHRMRGDKRFILSGGNTVGPAGQELLNGINKSLGEELLRAGVTVTLSKLDREFAGSLGAALFSMTRGDGILEFADRNSFYTARSRREAQHHAPRFERFSPGLMVMEPPLIQQNQRTSLAKWHEEMTQIHALAKDWVATHVDKKPFLHFIPATLIPENHLYNQRMMFGSFVHVFNALSSSANERIVLIEEDRMNDLRAMLQTGIRNGFVVDVALDDDHYLEDLPEGAKALIFKSVGGVLGDFRQLEGVVASLRALHIQDYRRKIEKLSALYVLLTGRYPQHIPSPEVTDKDFAMIFQFDIPPVFVTDREELRRLNENLLKLMTMA
ncbi:MAG: ROK family protein [Candidatus Omnitrophica bacterium]|nr:ROK family protein [Candidatus Omnitrophota bacterium]